MKGDIYEGRNGRIHNIHIYAVEVKKSSHSTVLNTLQSHFHVGKKTVNDFSNSAFLNIP